MDILEAVNSVLAFIQCPLFFTDIDLPYYGTLAGAINYFGTRLRTQVWDCSITEDRIKSLHEATRLIDRLYFVGKKYDPQQALEFPRVSTVRIRADRALLNQGPFPTGPYYNDPNYLGRYRDPGWNRDTPNCNFDGCETSTYPPCTPGPPPKIPTDIEIACYEIALKLLDGYDPDLEADNLASTAQGFDGVRATYDRTTALEHTRAGIPSAVAWSYLRPYLVDNRQVRLSRVD